MYIDSCRSCALILYIDSCHDNSRFVLLEDRRTAFLVSYLAPLPKNAKVLKRIDDLLAPNDFFKGVPNEPPQKSAMLKSWNRCEDFPEFFCWRIPKGTTTKWFRVSFCILLGTTSKEKGKGKKGKKGKWLKLHGSLVMSPFFTSPNHDRY